MALDVSVLMLQGCSSLSSIGPMELLLTAGRMSGNGQPGAEPFFRVQLVSPGTIRS